MDFQHPVISERRVVMLQLLTFTRKLLALRFLVFRISTLFYMIPGVVVAQDTLNALNYSGRSFVQGNVGGVGWSFVPTSDILVTSILSLNPEVSFWLGTNQIIASYSYPVDPVYYGGFLPIQPLKLLAGQNYSVSCEYSNFTGTSVYYTYESDLPPGHYGFTVSPYISQYGSYYLTPSGQWEPTTIPASENGDWLMGGPNFQFQVIPEPGSCVFLSLACGICFSARQIKKQFRSKL